GGDAGRGRMHGIVETLAHDPALEPAEVAAYALRALVIGFRARNGGEVGAFRPCLGSELVRLRPGGFARRSVGALGHAHQDVRYKALFGLDEAALFKFVARAQRGLVGRLGFRHGVGGDLDVFDRHLFRRTVVAAVAVIPGLDVGGGDRTG